MPRLGFRSLDLDSDAFTDVVPNDANTIATDTLTTADESIAAFSAKSEIMDIGVSVARSLGRLHHILTFHMQTKILLVLRIILRSKQMVLMIKPQLMLMDIGQLVLV